MSYFTPGGGQISVQQSGATNPSVQNIALTTAGTEYTAVIPTNSRQFELRSRTFATIQVAYTSGESGITYRTVPAGCAYIETGLLLSSNLTVYVQSTKNNDVLEVISWI
jgi:hypothetical protein